MTRFRGARTDLGFALWHHHGFALPQLFGIGHLDESVCLPTNAREAHVHDRIEIVYALSGRGERVCGGDRQRLAAGDACIVAPGVWHGARADAEDPYHFFALSVDGSRYGLRVGARDGITAAADGSGLEVELKVVGHRIVRRCHGIEDIFRRLILALDRFELERRGPTLTVVLVRALITELIVAIAERAIAGSERATEVAPTPQPGRALRREFRELVVWLPTRLTDPPALGEMAERVGLSPTHFAHAFKQEAGRSPHEFLLELRIEEAARRLLAEPGRPITAIAAEMGFATASYFSAAFRRAKRCTPGQWRSIAARAS